ncbi:hypothetical protein ASC88_14155 [Rhizobacter sp. Root29]|nr:hypothetical protein ASC88_14155 [Rhizobacter sp. Root29]
MSSWISSSSFFCISLIDVEVASMSRFKVSMYAASLAFSDAAVRTQFRLMLAAQRAASDWRCISVVASALLAAFKVSRRHTPIVDTSAVIARISPKAMPSRWPSLRWLSFIEAAFHQLNNKAWGPDRS